MPGKDLTHLTEQPQIDEASGGAQISAEIAVGASVAAAGRLAPEPYYGGPPMTLQEIADDEGDGRDYVGEADQTPPLSPTGLITQALEQLRAKRQNRAGQRVIRRLELALKDLKDA